MSSLKVAGSSVNAPIVTAEQIKNDCPTHVQDWGKQIAAHYDKLVRCEDKAEQHKIAIGLLLKQARETCDAGGFTAFRERFCPRLGKSRAHELLLIASGKKTVDETKTATRERVKKHRAAKKAVAPSVTVTDEVDTGAPEADLAPDDPDDLGSPVTRVDWPPRRPDGRVDRRLEHFPLSIGFLKTTGITAADMKFPSNLTVKMATDAIEDIGDAIGGLRKLKARLVAYAASKSDMPPGKAERADLAISPDLSIPPFLDRRPAPQTLIDEKPPVEEKPVDPDMPTDQSKGFTAVERAVEVATRQ